MKESQTTNQGIIYSPARAWMSSHANNRINCEKTAVATTIAFLMRNKGDKWLNFSIEEIKNAIELEEMAKAKKFLDRKPALAKALKGMLDNNQIEKIDKNTYSIGQPLYDLYTAWCQGRNAILE